MFVQVSLYLNVIYFPCWLSLTVMVTLVKYRYLNYLYKFVLVTVLVAVTIIEVYKTLHNDDADDAYCLLARRPRKTR